MLLHEIVEKGRFAFYDCAPNWREAIRMSCRPLVTTACATEGYAEKVIACVEEFGPYIVIVPGLAIPHAAKCVSGVTETAVSFVKFREPVYFEPGNEEKAATVFFALAAVDEDAHLKNMKGLFRLLSDEELLEKLKSVRSAEELLALEAPG